MAVSNTTSSNNDSWLDSLTGFATAGGNIWLQYESNKTQQELNKLQSQNSFNQGLAQISAYTTQQKQAFAFLMAGLAIAGVVLVLIFKRKR